MKTLRGIAGGITGALFLAILVAMLADRPLSVTVERQAAPLVQGAIEMDVLFRPEPDAPREPLVVTGESAVAGQTLGVVYQPGDAVVFEFRSKGADPLVSRPFRYEPGRTYRVRFDAGSLYAAAGDPSLAGRSALEIASLKRWVRLAIDDSVLLDAPTEEVTAPPGSVAIGSDRRSGEDGRFSGFVRRVRRAPLPTPLAAGPGHGDVYLVVNPPTGAVVGSIEPLLAAGPTAAPVLVGLKTNADRGYSLVLARPGAAPLESAPLKRASGALNLRIRLGAMLDLPASSPLAVLRGTTVVWIDGKPAWWTREPAPPVLLDGVLLHNAAASGPFAAAFTGRLAEWQAIPPPAPWRPGPFSSVTLLVGGRGSTADPLVATGVAGRADTLAIEWLPGDRARLVCDHWSVGAAASPEFEWRDGEAHAISVEFPSFATLDRDVGSVARGPLRVTVDGREVWSTSVEYYRASSASVALARNPAGSSIAASTMSAAVLDIIQ